MIAHRPAAIRYAYAEYACIPNDGRRWELIDGDFHVNPAPSTLHQSVSRRLQFQLMSQLEVPGLAYIFNAPFDVILSDHDVVQPDLVIIRTERRHCLSDRGLEGFPDLVVEILSPSNRAHDQVLKRAVYARHGIPEYWIVNPDHGRVEQLVLEGHGYGVLALHDRASTLTTPSFPQVSIPLGPVFQPYGS